MDRSIDGSGLARTYLRPLVSRLRFNQGEYVNGRNDVENPELPAISALSNLWEGHDYHRENPGRSAQ
jgi:hypothetical protein